MKRISVILFVLLTIFVCVSCSSSVNIVEINEPLVYSVSKMNGDAAEEKTYNNLPVYITDNDTCEGLITITLPDGLCFSSYMKASDKVPANWCSIVLDAESFTCTIDFYQDINPGDTELIIHFNFVSDDSSYAKLSFTIPSEAFVSANYTGKQPEFYLQAPKYK